MSASFIMFDSSMYEDPQRMRLSPTTAAKRKHELTLDIGGPFQTSSKRQKNLMSEQDGLGLSTWFSLQSPLTLATPEFDRLLMNNDLSKPLISDVDLQSSSASSSSSYDSPVAAGYAVEVSRQQTRGQIAPVPSVVEALAEQDDDPRPTMTGGRRQQHRRNVDAATVASSLTSRVESSPSSSNLSAASHSPRQPFIYLSSHPASCYTSPPSCVVDCRTDESQIVPSCRGGAVDGYERVKVEKKRERNRLAAQKCRLRKVQQIDSLQARVDELKEKNAMMEQAAEALRQELTTLRHHFSIHLNSGCRLMPPASSSGQSQVDFFP